MEKQKVIELSKVMSNTPVMYSTKTNWPGTSTPEIVMSGKISNIVISFRSCFTLPAGAGAADCPPRGELVQVAKDMTCCSLTIHVHVLT